jgi:drug/metabolite transporter (DMT)-like permease
VIEPGVGLALGAAASWGAGDVAGGLAARRAGGLVVAGGAQLTGFLLLLGGLLLLRPGPPDAPTLLLGGMGGVFGGLGLAALYRALAQGSMGLVSAVAGVGGVLISLGVGVLVWGDAISLPQLAGVGCAVAAAAAASGATRDGVSRQALILAIGAAIGFGLWFVFVNRAAEGGQLWALVAARGAATLVVGGMALARGGRNLLHSAVPLVALAGLLDVAANGLVVLSFATLGVGIAAALSGLYPLVTMLLARVLLGESLPRLGLVAVLIAVAGIVLISLGG